MPYPRALYHKVEFWKKVYTQYDTSQGMLHDADDLSIIYEEVQLPKSGNQSVIQERRYAIQQAIFGVLRKRGQNLSSLERKILGKFPKYASRSRLLQATENIRFQLGQSDRFKAGLINSGRYLKHIEQIIKEEGAPDFLKYLPHVESSFQEKAMSKFGAAGLWQLMPKTAQQFIRVNSSIDERWDPWMATRAAIRYLKQNYKRLEEWPLALTAYNHGAGGVMKAVRTLGTNDIAEIAFQYSTPSFGFASRNFYTQFLAAVQVAQDHRKYFGEIELAKPYEFSQEKLSSNTYLKSFLRKYNVNIDEFKALNRGLRKPVWQNRRPIPKGTIVRLPKNLEKRAPVMVASLDNKVAGEALKASETDLSKELSISAPVKSPAAPSLASLKKESSVEKSKAILESEAGVPELDATLVTDSRYDVQDLIGGKAWIRVEINETITQVAEWMDMNVSELRAWNGLGKNDQVRLGQRLLLKFDKRDVQSFLTERRDYHRQIREDFFDRYEVEEFVDYTIQVGENLWSICYQKFDVPPWLLEEFNQQVSISELKPGVHLKIPVLKEKFEVSPVESGLQSADNQSN